MYRRFKRRKRIPKTSVIHVPSSMNNALTLNNGLVFISALTGRVAGDPATDVIRSLGNREQEVVIGNHVGATTYSISLTDITASGMIEIAAFKADRKESTPVLGTVLPSAATINTSGLQQAIRMAIPGQVFKFMTGSFASEQPRQFTFTVKWSKFKKSKARAGDFYGLVIYNRSSQTIGVNVQARYKELS